MLLYDLLKLAYLANIIVNNTYTKIEYYKGIIIRLLY